jgi:hypothetical protein
MLGLKLPRNTIEAPLISGSIRNAIGQTPCSTFSFSTGARKHEISTSTERLKKTMCFRLRARAQHGKGKNLLPFVTRKIKSPKLIS